MIKHARLLKLYLRIKNEIINLNRPYQVASDTDW